MNLATVDLKLILVFDAIMRERSVSVAARRLGMSQPAVSNALNRLRTLLKDQLFTRNADGMQPTARAVDLSAPIADALAKIQQALEPREFSGATTDWSFSLAVSNQASIVIVPELLKTISRIAPRVRLRIEPKWNATILNQLDSALIDIAVGIVPNLPNRFDSVTLFEDRYVCVMRRDHPLARQPLSEEDFLAAGHLVVRPMGDPRHQQRDTLSRIGAVRKSVLSVSQFLAVPAILKGTDLIACLLESVARQYAHERLHICPVPFPSKPSKIVAAWSGARSSDAAIIWLRNQLQLASRQLAKQ
jgi:DNA-binding transcriptional LysR family regulator